MRLGALVLGSAAALLLGGAALAQQGTLIEPWAQASRPALAREVAAVAPPAAVGVAQSSHGWAKVVSPVPAWPSATPAAGGAARAAVAWAPPVVQLVVDPWGDERLAEPPRRPGWLPPRREVLDPWAAERSNAPHAAAVEQGAPRSTIF